MLKRFSSTMNGRLKDARLAAGFKSATDSIEFFHWKGSTYRAHENGQNNFSSDHASLYAKAYGVKASWLLLGDIEEKDIKENNKQKYSKFSKGCSLTKCPQKIQSLAFLLEDDPNNITLLEKLYDCVGQNIQLIKDK